MREKITSADNQQATSIKFEGASETIRQAPTCLVSVAYLQGALHDEEKDEDIVHALWRHRGQHEQGIRSGSCGWITSFLGRLSF